MKKLIIFLVMVAAIGSCTKKEVDPKPSVEAVVGTYVIDYMSVRSNGKTTTISKLPTTQGGITYSGRAELTSTAPDVIDVRILLLVDGKDDNPSDLEGFEFKKKGDAYGLYQLGRFIADLDGKTIKFDYTVSDKGETVFIKFNGKR